MMFVLSSLFGSITLVLRTTDSVRKERGEIFHSFTRAIYSADCSHTNIAYT